MNDGYIKLYRKVLDNPIIIKDGETLGIWIYLLLNATHKELKSYFKGEELILKPGQLITGREAISETLKVNTSKVQRTLKNFEKSKIIEQQTSNKNRLITIINWNIYQGNEQQMNNNRTTGEQQSNTYKNVKNVKNDKNIYIRKFEEFWSKYPKKRSKAKAKEWYIKNKPSDELHSKILMSIILFKDTEDWKKQNGQFIPYPTTFLNQKRWEDFMK